jgi:hypothetical protein
MSVDNIVNDVKQLRIDCAALKVGGEVHSLPPPARHEHIIKACARKGLDVFGRDMVYGFVLSDGSFVDRYKAMEIAKKAGQLKGVAFGVEALSTNHLW